LEETLCYNKLNRRKIKAIAPSMANKNHSRLKKSTKRFISGEHQFVMLAECIAKSAPGLEFFGNRVVYGILF
jgi:hypothetical protein